MINLTLKYSKTSFDFGINNSLPILDIQNQSTLPLMNVCRTWNVKKLRTSNFMMMFFEHAE